MTHREFLLWLQPELQKAGAKGLGRDRVRAIRRELERLRQVSPLQPFASRLFSLVCERTTLDGKTVASLVAEVGAELAPLREQTVVMSTNPRQHEKGPG
jgi:hypothetical protein